MVLIFIALKALVLAVGRKDDSALVADQYIRLHSNLVIAIQKCALLRLNSNAPGRSVAKQLTDKLLKEFIHVEKEGSIAERSDGLRQGCVLQEEIAKLVDLSIIFIHSVVLKPLHIL